MMSCPRSTNLVGNFGTQFMVQSKEIIQQDLERQVLVLGTIYSFKTRANDAKNQIFFVVFDGIFS